MNRIRQARGGLLAAACCAWLAAERTTHAHADEPTSAKSQTKDPTMTIQASRPPNPEIAAIEQDGVRYAEQPSGLGGILQATDIASGKVLWTLQVYEIEQTSAPVDTIGIYFASMKSGPGKDVLTIENEVGFRYEVDIAKKISTLVSSPKPRRKAVAPE